MGVPVVTLAGGCHAHNVGVSVLSAVGLAQVGEHRGAHARPTLCLPLRPSTSACATMWCDVMRTHTRWCALIPLP